MVIPANNETETVMTNPAQGVLQTKAEKAAEVRNKMLGKWDDTEYSELVQWLSKVMNIILFPSSDGVELTWMQSVGDTFVVVGKTSRKTLQDDIGEFYSEYEESQDDVPLRRYAVEASAKTATGTEIKFGATLGDLKNECGRKAASWKRLGFGEADTIKIDYVKITDMIPF